jgi:DNA primase catalytic subunit
MRSQTVLIFPHGMRVAAIEERRSYYESDFDVRSLSSWIGGRTRQLKFAMILGRHTGLVASERARIKDDVILIDDWDTAKDLRTYALDYLPESMYYDRNRYLNVKECAKCGDRKSSCRGCYNYCGQQLAFDLDPENVDCPYHGHIGEKIQSGRGLSFCMYEFKVVRKQAVLLSQLLAEQFDAVGVVYSGRGFHVVVDDERAYLLSKKERSSLAHKFGRKFAIDEWVTTGGSRLMRLPYSLNALVSRKCMVIRDGRDLKGFDPRSDLAVIPNFLRSS